MWLGLLVAVAVSSSAGTAAVDYYYYEGRPIALRREPSLMGVEFQPGAAVAAVGTFVSADGEAIVDEVVAEFPRKGRFVCKIKGKSGAPAGKQATLSLAGDPRVSGTYPVFRNPKTGLLVYVFDEFAVQLRPGVGERQLARLCAKKAVSVVEQNRYDPTIYLLRVTAKGQSCLNAANEFARSGLCLWAEPNFGGEIFKGSVNDPLFPNQWHLHNTGQGGGSVDADVDAPEAWAITTGSPGIVIATLDDGIDMGHEDLVANIFVNQGESGAGRETNGVDDDGNGYIDDVRGWDFFDDDNNPDHDHRVGSLEGHGTSVAGIAAAAGDNALGVSGVAYTCRILPIKVFKGNDFAGNYEVGNAFRYASTIADVLSNSWGGGTPSKLLEGAIEYAVQNGRGGRGCPVTVASGNFGEPVVSSPSDNIWTVAVGASDPNDVRFDYSNYGSHLTLICPSGGWTTDITGLGAGYDDGDPTGNYTGVFGGTSSATPLVSGVAALVLSLDPSLTALQVQRLLQGTTDPINPGEARYNAYGFSQLYGYGRINAEQAAFQAQAGGAVDDQFEDNDTRANAVVIDKGFYSALAALDEDWYALDVEPFQDFVADLQFIHARGDLQLEIYDHQGNSVAASLGTTNSEHVAATVGNTGGLWTVRVYGEGGATNYYHMTVNKRPPDDHYEPNDTIDDARTILPGDHEDLRGYDPDYYAVQVGAGEKITAVIRFAGELGDLDVFLLASDGSILSSSDLPDADVEGVWHRNSGGDTTFYILVDNYLDAENAYRLELVVEPGADDGFENNNSRASATPIGPGVYAQLQGYDDDYYRVAVGPNKILEAEIHFLNAIGDLDLEIQNTSGGVLDASEGVVDFERVVWMNSGVSTTVVHPHVYPYGIDYPSYKLALAISDRGDDPHEDNDDFDTPTPVDWGTLGDLQALDDDYFAVPANQGTTIAALLNAESSQTPLRLTLYSPTGVPLESTIPGEQPVIVFRPAPTTGTYRLRVRPESGGAGSLYGLSAFVSSGGAGGSSDDRFEPNNIRATEAAPVIGGAYPGLFCANTDHFSIRLLESDSLYVAIAFDSSAADLDMSLLDSWGQEIDFSAGYGGTEFVALDRAPADGTYFITIRPYSGKARYDLLIGHWPRGLLRRGDLLGARHWTLY